mmetsp:Transcript_26758/g.79474  ORF Transcript_26758/g.79474 Transcript_26758/m.79474 type:complete len:94 (+) Transcript_26758:1137-1418(+)
MCGEVVRRGTRLPALLLQHALRLLLLLLFLLLFTLFLTLLLQQQQTAQSLQLPPREARGARSPACAGPSASRGASGVLRWRIALLGGGALSQF